MPKTGFRIVISQETGCQDPFEVYVVTLLKRKPIKMKFSHISVKNGSISRKFEVVKFLTLLVNFENFEMVLPPRFSRYNISKTCFRHFYEFRSYVGTSEFI